MFSLNHSVRDPVSRSARKAVKSDALASVETSDAAGGHWSRTLRASCFFATIYVVSLARTFSVNQFGNENNLSCASNEKNHAAHIFDYRDADGCCGATASIVVNSFIDYYEKTHHWQAMAWWIHDHLPPTDLYFFPKLAAFNISWHEKPTRTIKSYAKPMGTLTKPGMSNFEGSHEEDYAEFLASFSG